MPTPKTIAPKFDSRQLIQTEPVKTWPAGSKRWALVIGVDEYYDRQITPLRGATNDARTLAAALNRYAGFPAEQIILLANDQPDERKPTRSNILKYLSNLRGGLVPRDGLLLVSFAGHGIERENRSYLLPADALWSNDIALLEDTAINVERVRDSIKKTEVGQVVLILDNCRNDPSAGRGGGDNRLTEGFRNSFDFDVRNHEVQAFVTLLATDVGQRAYEYSEKEQGYFTWTLIEGLKGGAANQNGEITLANLVKYLQDRVPKYVHRDLGNDKQQRPISHVEGYRADELVIAISPPPSTPN